MRSNISSTLTIDTEAVESIDASEQIVITAERHIARLRSIQIEALEALDRSQVATADGSRSLAKWVAARADVSAETARDLVRTMRRTECHAELRRALSEGETTFDRVSAVARIEDGDHTDPLLSHLDISAVRRESARRNRIDDETETRTFRDRFLFMQPSLDESWWRVFGGLDGMTGTIVDRALATAADQLPDDPAAPRDSSWRRATALAAICIGDETASSQGHCSWTPTWPHLPQVGPVSTSRLGRGWARGCWRPFSATP